MAVNKYPWVKNLNGADPLIFLGKVQAGDTKEIKRGEICDFNETSGYWTPIDAVADNHYSLAIAHEEQKADDSARYMEFMALRPEDVFEFELDSSDQVELGDGLELTVSNSQKLTRDVDGNAVAFMVGMENYPEEGTTLRYRSYAQVSFNPVFSYWAKDVMRLGLKKVMAKTDDYTLLPGDLGALITNKGDGGAMTITAPDGTVPVGWWVRIMCAADEDIKFDPKPNTAKVYIAGAAQSAGNYVQISDIGDFMELTWDGADWLCDLSISGADGDIAIEGA